MKTEEELGYRADEISSIDIEYIISLAKKNGATEFSFTNEPIFNRKIETYRIENSAVFLTKKSKYLRQFEHDYGISFREFDVLIYRHDCILRMMSERETSFTKEIKRCFAN